MRKGEDGHSFTCWTAAADQFLSAVRLNWMLLCPNENQLAKGVVTEGIIVFENSLLWGQVWGVVCWFVMLWFFHFWFQLLITCITWKWWHTPTVNSCSQILGRLRSRLPFCGSLCGLFVFLLVNHHPLCVLQASELPREPLQSDSCRRRQDAALQKPLSQLLLTLIRPGRPLHSGPSWSHTRPICSLQAFTWPQVCVWYSP